MIKLMKVPLLFWLISCSVLAGCATQGLPDVGQVVVAPQVKLPPVPTIVQATPAMEPGYYQSKLLSFFGSKPQVQTKSTSPTLPAAPTPTK